MSTEPTVTYETADATAIVRNSVVVHVTPSDVIRARPFVQLLKIGRLDARARGERGGRSKSALLDERGSYVLVGHGTLLPGAMRSIAESSRGGLQPRMAASRRSMLARACRT